MLGCLHVRKAVKNVRKAVKHVRKAIKPHVKIHESHPLEKEFFGKRFFALLKMVY